jgi:hypothetical protein
VLTKFPGKLTVSAGIGEKVANWWESSLPKSSGQANTITDNVGYGKYGNVSLGGYYIPDYNSFSSYVKRIVYRGGLKYEKPV